MIGRILCALGLHRWMSDPPFRLFEATRQLFVYRCCKRCQISDEKRVTW